MRGEHVAFCIQVLCVLFLFAHSFFSSQGVWALTSNLDAMLSPMEGNSRHGHSRKHTNLKLPLPTVAS